MAKEKSVAPTTNAVKKEDVKKLGFFKRVKKWFREMRSELKKVVWPSKSTVIKNTTVALAVMAVAAIAIWGFDQIAQLGFQHHGGVVKADHLGHACHSQIAAFIQGQLVGKRWLLFHTDPSFPGSVYAPGQGNRTN